MGKVRGGRQARDEEGGRTGAAKQRKACRGAVSLKGSVSLEGAVRGQSRGVRGDGCRRGRRWRWLKGGGGGGEKRAPPPPPPPALKRDGRLGYDSDR